MFESITHQIKNYQNLYETLRARRCDTTSGRLIRLKPSGSIRFQPPPATSSHQPLQIAGNISIHSSSSKASRRVCWKLFAWTHAALLVFFLSQKNTRKNGGGKSSQDSQDSVGKSKDVWNKDVWNHYIIRRLQHLYIQWISTATDFDSET